MTDLMCEHCGAEKGYADANIADIRGETCPENTEKMTSHVDGHKRTATLEKEHEWIEPDKWDNLDMPEESHFELHY